MENDTKESINERVEEKLILDEEPQPVEGQFLNTIIHRSIGAFTFNNVQKKSSGGSGVLISRNLVLTAAHNLYDKKSQQEFNKKTYKFYYEAKDGIATKFYEVADWRFLQQFLTCKEENNFSFDYALVKLEKSVDLPSFPPLTLPCKVCLDSKKQQLGIFGYPKSGSNYQPDSQGKSIKLRQFGLKREFKIVSFEPQGQLIKYAISTLKGHSGAPVIFDEKIIAVHNGGGRENQKFNIGKLVTNDLLYNLASWVKQLKGEKFVTSHCEHVKKQMLEQAQTLFKKGYVEYSKTSYDSALNYFDQCLQIQIEAVGKGGRETANTLSYIGHTYQWQRNYAKAIQYYKQYITIQEKYQEEMDQWYIDNLTFVGYCFIVIKDFKSGAEYFEQRLLHHQQIQNQKGVKLCAIWLAKNLRALGENQRAAQLKKKYDFYL